MGGENLLVDGSTLLLNSDSGFLQVNSGLFGLVDANEDL